jgi:hypothetical protein
MKTTETLTAAMMEYKPEEPAQNIAERITEALNARKDRSAWGRGVNEYALELAEELRERIEREGCGPCNLRELERWLLDGASDWHEYSRGGCSMIYNSSIAERLCTASELRKTDNGRKDPNPREQWLDVQARALYQASRRVVEAWNSAHSEEIPLF